MCQSACENFFRVCGYDEDLWMCKPVMDDDFDMESTEKLNDVSQLYFPGAPFKRNEYKFDKRKGEPKEVCTPSIQGSSSQREWIVAVAISAFSICYLILD
jgi:hypothetical protein